MECFGRLTLIKPRLWWPLLRGAPNFWNKNEKVSETLPEALLVSRMTVMQMLISESGLAPPSVSDMP